MRNEYVDLVKKSITESRNILGEIDDELTTDAELPQEDPTTAIPPATEEPAPAAPEGAEGEEEAPEEEMVITFVEYLRDLILNKEAADGNGEITITQLVQEAQPTAQKLAGIKENNKLGVKFFELFDVCVNGAIDKLKDGNSETLLTLCKGGVRVVGDDMSPIKEVVETIRKVEAELPEEAELAPEDMEAAEDMGADLGGDGLSDLSNMDPDEI
jgi:hypothetical protein